MKSIEKPGVDVSKSVLYFFVHSNKIEKPRRDVGFPGLIRFYISKTLNTTLILGAAFASEGTDTGTCALALGVAMAIDNEVPAENAQRLPFEFTNLSSNVQTIKSIFVADSLSSISAEVSATMIKNQHKHIQNDIKTPNAHPYNHPNDHHP